jgi:hypothetical protein
MAPRIQRTTVDLSSFPDLVVIYLGMKVRNLRGLRTMISFGPKLNSAIQAKPEGLLLHESLLFSLFPLAHWNAAILERLSIAGKLGAISAPSGMVGRVPEEFRRHRLLARDLLHARRHGSDLR